MKQYLDLLSTVMHHGDIKHDRTGVGTKSIFGHQMRFDLSQSFPLITTKKVHFKSVVHELLWFIKGDTNIQYLNQNGVNIWNEWADSAGNLGPIYGKQWRSWKTADNKSIDQLSIIINTLKTNPDSRRLIVNAWNVGELSQMALPPCHCLFQFYTVNNKLSCQLYQRSADVFLGVPFNIASYALLTYMIAHQTQLDLGEFIWTGGDCHLYLNHTDQATLQLQRTPYSSPKLLFKQKPASLFDYVYEDIILENYQHHDPIKAPIAV